MKFFCKCQVVRSSTINSKDSIQLYLKLLERDLNIDEFRKELYIFEKEKIKKANAEKAKADAER